MSSPRVVFAGPSVPPALTSWASDAALAVVHVTSTAAASDALVSEAAALVVVAIGLDRLGELAGLARLRELPGGRTADLVLVCPKADVERLSSFAAPLRVYAVVAEPLEIRSLPRPAPSPAARQQHAATQHAATRHVAVETAPAAPVTRRQSATVVEESVRRARPGQSGVAGGGTGSASTEASKANREAIGLSLADLRARVMALGRQDHFQRLGVPREVDNATLATVFGAFEAQLRPTNYLRAPNGAAPVAEALLRALTTAYDTLADPTSRAAYVARLGRAAGPMDRGAARTPAVGSEAPTTSPAALRPLRAMGHEPVTVDAPKQAAAAAPAWLPQEEPPSEESASRDPASGHLAVPYEPDPSAAWELPEAEAVAPQIAALEVAPPNETEVLETADVEPPQFVNDATFEDVDDIFRDEEPVAAGARLEAATDDGDGYEAANDTAANDTAANDTASAPAVVAPPSSPTHEAQTRVRRTPEQALAAGAKDWLLEARFFALMGDFDRATALVDACAGAEPNSRRFQYWQGTICGLAETRRGNFAAARSCLDRALRLAGPGQTEAAVAAAALEQAERAS
jgi:hypothetical protein